MLDKLTFKNYKPFKEYQELILKPMTVLIGKNSSGKSAVAKLPTLIENSLKGDLNGPLLLKNNGVELGAEFKDLVCGRTRIGIVEFGLHTKNEILEIAIGAGTGTKDLPQIFEWKLKNQYGIFDKDLNEKYKGFILQTNKHNLMIKDIDFNVDYFGPFRVKPQRDIRLDIFSKIEKIGIPEESAYQLLIQDALTTEKSLLEKVSNWYRLNFGGWGLRVNEDKAPIYQIELTRNNGSLNINIADVGQGMSQVLPLVARAFMATDKNIMVIIEQPELHLHPAAHGDLAQLFVSSLKEGSKKYLIETHSQNFVLRLRRLVAEGVLDKNDLALYFVNFDEDNGTSKLELIKVDESGEVDFWPENIFNESLDEVLAIRRAQKIAKK